MTRCHAWRGSAAGRAAVLADPTGRVGTRDEVFTVDEYLTTYVLAWTLHHLDLIARLPDAADPPAVGLARSRALLESIAGAAFPASLSDRDALLIGTGRRPRPRRRRPNSAAWPRDCRSSSAEVPVEYRGDVRADLTRYPAAIVDGLERMRLAGRPAASGDASAGLVAEVAAAAARHADIGSAVQAVFVRRNALVLRLIEQARDAGELHEDVEPEVLFDQLAGALYYRLLITGRPIGTAYVDRLVAGALRGAAARGGPGTGPRNP